MCGLRQRVLPLLLASLLAACTATWPAEPLRLGVAGLVHGHVSGFFRRALGREDVVIAGIAETDTRAIERYRSRYGLDAALFHAALGPMLDAARPDAVVVFSNTRDHRAIVEACAARRLPVKMEKPLAQSLADARAIEQAARAAQIPVLVNYETIWRRNIQSAYQIVTEQEAIGELRKLVVHIGHSGPKELGCAPEFLEWLGDPALGGGALDDFACYGANLATWLMGGARPTSVACVVQQIKPDVYPDVEDEATLLLTYPKAQAILHASWNAPFDRKDLEIYGQTGSVLTVEQVALRVRIEEMGEEELNGDALAPPYDDPLNYLAAVVRGEIRPAGLPSLENNLIVSEILDAAHESARTGRRIELPLAR